MFIIYISLAINLWEIKLGEFKCDRKYFNDNKFFWLLYPKLVRIYLGRSTNCFIYCFVIQVISVKAFCSKRFYEQFHRYIFLHENNRNCNPSRFTGKLTFTSLLTFLNNQKIRIKFSANWWSGNKKYFFFVYNKSDTT